MADVTPEKLAAIVAERNRRFKDQINAAWTNRISPPPLIFDTFERHNRRAWLVVAPKDGRIPPRTASMMPAGYDSRDEIVQSPDSVTIRYEMIHEARIVPLDRRPHLAPSVRPGCGGGAIRSQTRDRVLLRLRPRRGCA